MATEQYKRCIHETNAWQTTVLVMQVILKMVKNWQEYRQQSLDKYHPENLEKLYELMPRRMMAVIEAQGGHAKS